MDSKRGKAEWTAADGQPQMDNTKWTAANGQRAKGKGHLLRQILFWQNLRIFQEDTFVQVDQHLDLE